MSPGSVLFANVMKMIKLKVSFKQPILLERVVRAHGTNLIPGNGLKILERKLFQSRHCHSGYRAVVFVDADRSTTRVSWSIVSQSERL